MTPGPADPSPQGETRIAGGGAVLTFRDGEPQACPNRPTDREIVAALVKELRDLRARFHRALIYEGSVREFADAAVADADAALKLAERAL